MSHLRVVVENSDRDVARERQQALLDRLVDSVAARYYHRVCKPSAPVFDDLDEEAQDEYRAHVRPIAFAALEMAVTLGLHHEGTRP